MSISSINSSNLLNGVLAAAYSNETREAGPASGAFGSDNTEISSIGALMSSISRMDEDDQSDIKSFLDDLKSSVEDGTFDAETAAAEAPDALQEYAEENGIDLADLVQDLADGAEEPGVYGPPPPPDSIEGDAGASSNINLDLSALEDMSDDERSEVQTFMESLKSSLEDGTFDADTLAATAPDVLEDLAEENGITISELIQELADEAENAPAPPAMMGSSQYQDSEAIGGVGTIFNSEA